MGILRKFRILHLAAIFLFCSSASLSSDTATKVAAFSETDIELRYTAHDSPILIVDNQIVKGIEPEWFRSYIAVHEFTEMTFDEFLSFATPAYLNHLEIDRETYTELAEDSTLHDIVLPQASILSEIYLTIDGREILIVKYYEFDLLETFHNTRDLRYATANDVFEKLDGRWKRQLPSELGRFQDLVVLDREELEEILKSGTMFRRTHGLITPHLR